MTDLAGWQHVGSVRCIVPLTLPWWLRPAGIILLFVVLAFLCKRFDIGKYRSLPDASRLVFVCHNAFFLIFLTTAIPYSIALVKVLFAPTAPLPLLQSSMYRCMSFPLALQVGMYVLEVSKQWNMCQGYIMLQRCRHCSCCWKACTNMLVIRLQPSFLSLYCCLTFLLGDS